MSTSQFERKFKNREEYIKMATDEVVKENEQLKKQLEESKIQIKELNETNNHLITATWRERELKNELEKSKKLIEYQHDQIAGSINYAKKIQQALIANNEQLKPNFIDSFIFYKAKDVVSGDFPWMYKKGDYLYFAAVDCTGHGVPGAILATIGSLLLNDIVNNDGFPKPSDMLNHLHKAIVKTLDQENNKKAANDGMDIALCRLNLKTRVLNYSGAHRPLLIYQNQNVIKKRGCPYPIGGCQYKHRKNYKDIEIQLNKNDVFYIYSDGVPDQFGGEFDDKFGTQKINDIIISEFNQEKPFFEIEKKLKKEILKWMNIGNETQTDDMLLICVKVS